MRIVSVRPFLLGEWRVCQSRCGMVGCNRLLLHRSVRNGCGKTSYGFGRSSDNWVIFAKVLRKSEVL